jgi:hypothetical protein
LAASSPAVQEFPNKGFKTGQRRKLEEYRDDALAAKRAGKDDTPHWVEFWIFFYRSRGERVHAYFKAAVVNDRLPLEVFRPGVKEPDIRAPATSLTGRWWADVTTEGEWTAHVSKYTAEFGDKALGLIHMIKNTKHSS